MLRNSIFFYTIILYNISNQNIINCLLTKSTWGMIEIYNENRDSKCNEENKKSHISR